MWEGVCVFVFFEKENSTNVNDALRDIDMDTNKKDE